MVEIEHLLEIPKIVGLLRDGERAGVCARIELVEGRHGHLIGLVDSIDVDLELRRLFLHENGLGELGDLKHEASARREEHLPGRLEQIGLGLDLVELERGRGRFRHRSEGRIDLEAHRIDERVLED